MFLAYARILLMFMLIRMVFATISSYLDRNAVPAPRKKEWLHHLLTAGSAAMVYSLLALHQYYELPK